MPGATWKNDSSSAGLRPASRARSGSLRSAAATTLWAVALTCAVEPGAGVAAADAAGPAGVLGGAWLAPQPTKISEQMSRGGAKVMALSLVKACPKRQWSARRAQGARLYSAHNND